MLPKLTGKRGFVAFRVDAETAEYLEYLKKERYIDTPSWLRAVLSEAIEKVKEQGGEVSYGSSEIRKK